MRILVVNVFYAPQSIGGATRVVEDNVRDFKSSMRVDEVAVFCSLNGAPSHGMSRHYVANGVQVQSIATRLVENADFLLSDKLNRERFAEFLDYYCPDIIHFHCLQRLTSDLALEARERDIPYVITMHDGWWISDKQFLVDESGNINTYNFKEPETVLENMDEDSVERITTLTPVLHSANTILTVSKTFRNVIEGAGLENIKVIENGVSPITVLPKSSSDKVTLGYLAGAAHYKGYHFMRAAITKGSFSNLNLIVVDHSLRQGQSIREQWGETDVERIGFVAQEKVSELYQRLHVVLVPSIWPESFGLVAREALQSRSWLVASNRGAAAEDIKEGVNGHVFDPAKPGDFERVLGLIDDNVAKYCAPSPETKLKSSSEQSEELLDLYQEILSS